jgi:RHS repeat-associated protein
MGLAVAVPPGAAGAAGTWPPRKPAPPRLVDTVAVPVKPAPPDAIKAAAAGGGLPSASWPAAGSAQVQVASHSSAGPTRAASLPVWIGPPSATPVAGAAAGAPPTPAAVQVQLLDHATTTRQGVDGLVLRLHRTDGQTGAGRVSLTVDYSGFRGAYGGDWAARLRLVESSAGGTGPATVLATRNDLNAGRVTAEVSVAETDATFALTAAPNGETGDYKATSLSPSGTWSVATQSGDFDYSYPLPVPSVPGGLEPKLTLEYSSGSVDGHTAATNNQPSWVGEGWSLWPGFIERQYKSCFDDIADPAKRTGDLCWHTNATGSLRELWDAATLSLDGHASQLVYAGNSTWRLKNDDGTRVQRLTGAANGDQGDVEGAGEHWKLTTTDGTQYLFGRTTASAWTVPVFGNDAGEPCNKSTFDASWCQQAWRWNLDQVIDPHGNTISYFYTPETNNYSRNLDGAKATRYVRGGVLEHVEYGARAGQHWSAQVLFATAGRGTPAPDVPSDQACADGQNCGTHYSPTFWSTKRLASVTTQVWDGAAARDVDRWTLEHAYPANQDGTTASLWLHGITRTGLAASPAVALPQVVFDGTQLANRLNSDTDGLLPLDKWRVARINNETGGWIWVNYVTTDCVPTAPPDPTTNTKRCFPVNWTPDGDQLRHDWMIKYVTGSVVAEDRVGGQPAEVTSYDYGTGGAAWHYDDNPLLPDKFRSWSQYRGFADVVVKHGDAAAVIPSATKYTYFRGMSGDHLPNGGTRPATVKDSQGQSLDDAEQLAGFVREQQTYNGAGGPVLSSAINDPWSHGPTATQGSLKAYVVRTEWTVTRTALQADNGSLRGWRTTKVHTDYTDEGLPWKVNDLADDSTAADDRCTTTTYARNEASWLLDLPAEVKVDGVACTTTPAYPGDAVSDTLTYYDNSTTVTAPPSAGNPTRVEQVKDYLNGTPSWVTTTRGSFDAYGRPQDTYDALGRKTSTRYSPASGLPTSTTVTSPPVDPSQSDPITMTTTTSLDPVLGMPVTVTDPNQRRTDLTYDALGRLLGVWRPGRSKQNGDGPNQRYAYRMRADGPSWVSTDTLKPNNNYLTSYQLYDGFLRERQTQSLGPNPDPTKPPLRVVTDTLHDTRGLAFQRNGPYSDTGTPGTSLVTVADNQVPSLSRTTFDAAERPVSTVMLSRGAELAKTTTRYFGDHTEVTPPAGGTPTATFTDARGQTSQIWQYKAATPGGEHTTTSYGYTHAGKLAAITDTAHNTWGYSYDLLGRQTASSDPDKGASTMTYDDAGQLTATRDARGITLAYKYDGLGRKTEEHQDSLTGPKLASWTYDTILKGQLTSSTRKAGTETFTRTVTGYDAAYRPTGSTISVPGAPAPLDSDWSTTTTYKPDGSPATVTLPSLPGIGGETLTYSYDSLGMPYELKNAAFKYVHDAAYTEFGELSQIQLGATPDQALQTFYFDMGTRRLARAVVDLEHDQQPGQPPRSVQDLNYTYDPAGNLTRLADTPTIGDADKQCFTYDPLRRLREAWTTTAGTCGAAGGNPGGPAPYWISYSFDDLGNRLTDTAHAVVGSATTTTSSRTFTYPAGGQPRPHAVTSVGAAGAAQTAGTYSYDPSGNTISRPGPSGTQTLTWTPEGKLSTVTGTAGVTTDQYDADANLLLTKDSTGTTLYLDGAEVRATPAGQTSATRYYSFAGATVGVRTSTGGLSWLAHDHHGTDTLAVDATTSAAIVRRGDPFGNPRGTQPTWPGSHGFVGGVTQQTGVTHLGAREYDPQLGKFLSVDPVLDPADPQQMNAYAYANNNPTTGSDPTGLFLYLDDESGATIPSLAHATADQIAQAQGKSERYFRARDEARRHQDKVAQHDWNGLDGPRGRVGGYNAKPVIPALQKPPARLYGPGGPPDIDDLAKNAKKLLEENVGKVIKSGSVCVEAAIATGSGAGYEICTNFDGHGVTVSGSTRFGVDLGVEAYAAVVVKLNFGEDAAEVRSERLGYEQVKGPEGMLGNDLEKLRGQFAASKLKYGWFAGIEVTEDQHQNQSLVMKAGYGGGMSLGGYYATLNINSGYLQPRQIIELAKLFF